MILKLESSNVTSIGGIYFFSKVQKMQMKMKFEEKINQIGNECKTKKTKI